MLLKSLNKASIFLHS